MNVTTISQEQRISITSKQYITMYHQYHIDITSVPKQLYITSASHRYHIGAPQAIFFTQDVPRDATRDVPRDIRRDVPHAVPRDVPRDVPPDVPCDVPRDVPYSNILATRKLNLSHTTSASLPEAQLIAYYLREPPGQTPKHKILLFVFENALF